MVIIAALGPRFVLAPVLALFLLVPRRVSLGCAYVEAAPRSPLGVGGRGKARGTRSRHHDTGGTSLFRVPRWGVCGHRTGIGDHRHPPTGNVELGLWGSRLWGRLEALERFYLVSNRLYTAADALGFNRIKDGYFSWAVCPRVCGALGLAMISGGLCNARHRVRWPEAAARDRGDPPESAHPSAGAERGRAPTHQTRHPDGSG